MKSTYVYLNGGLGNQMFQYATARAFALRNGAQLIVDSWSGFVRDYEYNRSYELHKFPIQARRANVFERIPIWLFRLHNKFRHNPKNLVLINFYGKFLVENESCFIEDVIHYRQTSSKWLVGYWQSPHYFEDYAGIIRTELMPPRPTQKNFLDMGQLIRETESVAIGIRLYEESQNPSAHAKDGLLKSMAQVNAAIARLLTLQPRAKIFLFCTHRSPTLAELNLPASTVFITHDEGYEGTTERLWLLTQCKHHIFTNSSYYWWGAWLSHRQYSLTDVQQHIFAADNFINQDSLSAKWERF